MRRLVARVLLAAVFGIVWLTSAGGLDAADAGKAGASAPHAKDYHAGESKSGDHEEGAVPLDLKKDLAFWSFVVFVLFAFILGKFAWGPLSAGLAQREVGIRKNIADAEEARVKAERMLAEHAAKLDKVQEEVRAILAEARRDAEHTKQDIMNEAQSEAEATKHRAIGEINRARDTALKDLFDVMSSQVASATEHVLGRSLNAADQDRLIDEALAQLSAR